MLQVLACGGDYDSPAGFIDFPPGEGTEYGHSLACDYTIRVAEGKVVTNIFMITLITDLCPQVVRLTFTQFRLEAGGARGCGFDWLAIRDGDTRAPEMGRYCGQDLPGDNGTILTTRNIATLEFR